jgi:hypothetical protein
MTPDAITVEMQGRTRELCQVADPIVKVALHRISIRLGITLSRVKQFYYGEAKRIEAWESDRVRSLHEKMTLVRARQAEIDAELKNILDGRGCHDGQMAGAGDDALVRVASAGEPGGVRDLEGALRGRDQEGGAP